MCCCLFFSTHKSHRGNLSGIWRQAGKHHLRASVNPQTHLSLAFTRLRTADTFGEKSVGRPMVEKNRKVYSGSSIWRCFSPLLLFTGSISGDRDFNQANKIICLRQSRPGNKINFEVVPSYIFCNLHGASRQHAFRQPLFNRAYASRAFHGKERITFYFRKSIVHLRGISLN